MLGDPESASRDNTGRSPLTMKINGPGSIGRPPARPNRVSRGGKGSEFSLRIPSDSPSTAPVSAAGSMRPVEALLALQEVPDATGGRSRGIAHGTDLLDRLDEIRLALLGGTIPRDTLIALQRRVRARKRTIADAQLAEILDEIDLRAAVELAKLGITP